MFNVLLILLALTVQEYNDFVKNPRKYTVYYPYELQNIRVKVEPNKQPVIVKGNKELPVPLWIVNWDCVRLKMNTKIFHDAGVDLSHAQVWAVFAKPEFWYPAAAIEISDKAGYCFTLDLDYSDYITSDLKRGSSVPLPEQTGGSLGTYHGRLINLYPDDASKAELGIIDSIATLFVNEMWSAILSALDAVVAGAGATIDEITDMSIQTTCDWGRWPSLTDLGPFHLGLFTDLYAPFVMDLWIGKDTVKVKIPGTNTEVPVPLTFLLQAPEALPLYVLTPTITQSTIGVPVGLDGIECLRLSAGQFGGALWEKIQPILGDTVQTGESEWDNLLGRIPLVEWAHLYTNGCWGLSFPTTAYQMTSSDWQATANEAMKLTYLYFNLCYGTEFDTVNVPYIGPVLIPHGWMHFAKHKDDYNIQRYYPRFHTQHLGGCVNIGQVLPTWEMIPPSPENTNPATARDLSKVGYLLWIKYHCKTTLYLKVKLSLIPSDTLKTGGMR